MRLNDGCIQISSQLVAKCLQEVPVLVLGLIFIEITRDPFVNAVYPSLMGFTGHCERPPPESIGEQLRELQKVSATIKCRGSALTTFIAVLDEVI